MIELANFLCKSLLVKIVLAACTFSAMTAVKTSPLLPHLGTHVPHFSFPDPIDLVDPLLITWILAWNFHSLTTDPWNLFNANIFYPVPNSLAFSEHLLGVLPIFAPVYALTGNPILGYNVVVFLSFVLSAMAMFLLIHYWTQHFWAALLAGFLFAFTPLRFWQISHMQLLNFYWAPLVLLFWERFLRSKRWGDLIGFAILYWFQVLCSVYLGWFITIAVTIYGLYHALFIDRGLLSRSMIPRYVTFAVFSLLIFLPLHLPYYEAKHQWGFHRSLSECILFSADALLSYLAVYTPMNDFHLSLFRFASNLSLGLERSLFPGSVLAFLVVFGSLPIKRFPLPAGLKQLRRGYWLLLISSFILSLGPYLIILGKNTGIPLPYLLLYHIVPGFQAMRVPSRFGGMVVLSASVLAALGFLKACASIHRYIDLKKRSSTACQAVLALLCLGVFTWELGLQPVPLARIPTGDDIPEVYRWLAAKGLRGPIVELPHGGLWEPWYTYLSTYHWLPLVNGYSGFMPPTHAQIAAELSALPSPQAVQSLSALGVQGIIVHTDQLRPHEVLQWRQAPLTAMGLEQVAAFGGDLVYRVAFPVGFTHQLRVAMAVPERLPSGMPLTLGLLAEGVDHGMWLHPRPLGRTRVIVEWVDERTGKTVIQQERSQWPLLIHTQERWPMALSVQTPSSPGRYLLRVRVPTFDMQTDPLSVELTLDPVPTSVNAPHILSAAYHVEGMPAGALPSAPIRLALTAVNTGGAVWLAHAPRDRGAVRLGWRWLKGDRYVPSTLERVALAYDVFPGQSYPFTATIPTPKDPGEYTLELGLVSELVAWFADQGTPPLRVAFSAHDSISSHEGVFQYPQPPPPREDDAGSP